MNFSTGLAWRWQGIWWARSWSIGWLTAPSAVFAFRKQSYCGEDDTACHAHKGRTKRTEVMYMEAGTIYIYLCYGVHWLLNIVTGDVEDPQAVLIRACVGAAGPGKLTKALQITGDLNRGSVLGDEVWVEDDGFDCCVTTGKRVGISYAAKEDQDKLWRFKIK